MFGPLTALSGLSGMSALAGGDPSATLPNQLAAYWKLEEASGTRNASVSAYHLTSNNAVGQAAGKQGNAASFAAASTQYLSVASNSDLSPGNTDFTVALWLYLATKTASRTAVAKADTGKLEYLLNYPQTPDRFRFAVSADGASYATNVAADALGAPAVNTWYFVVAWHDSAGDTINIQVNDGTINSAAHSTGLFQGNAAFQLGATLLSGAASLPWDGRIDEVGFWRRVLTAAEKTYLYNSGSGRTYPF